MNLPPNVFDVDRVTKIRSELSITVLEKKMNKILALKKVSLVNNHVIMTQNDNFETNLNCWNNGVQQEVIFA